MTRVVSFKLGQLIPMNTDNTPFNAPRPAAPFHRSTRTALTENFDAATGTTARTLCTSTLTLAWQADELVIGFGVVQLKVEGAARRTERQFRHRGA